MGKILRISLKLNFTPNTLGCCGLSNPNLSVCFADTSLWATGRELRLRRLPRPPPPPPLPSRTPASAARRRRRSGRWGARSGAPPKGSAKPAAATSRTNESACAPARASRTPSSARWRASSTESLKRHSLLFDWSPCSHPFLYSISFRLTLTAAVSSFNLGLTHIWRAF